MRVAVLVALSLAVLPSSAAATGLERFYLPGGTGFFSRPVARGPDGRVWMGLNGAIGAVDRDGSVQIYDNGGQTPSAIATAADGSIWSIAGNADDRVVRLVPGVGVRVFRPRVPNNDLAGIAASPDGGIWVAEETRHRIARFAPDGTHQDFSVGRSISVFAVASGPDGNVWFVGDVNAAEGDAVVGRLTLSGAVTTWRLHADMIDAESAPIPVISAGPDGNLWVATDSAKGLARVTPSGAVAYVAVGGAGNADTWPESVTAGPDGRLWFTSYADIGSIAADGTGVGRYTDPLGPGSDCQGGENQRHPSGPLAFADDGTLWVPYDDGTWDRLARDAAAQPAPVRPVLPARGDLRAPNSIVRGDDGSAWIATDTAVVRVDATGTRSIFHPYHRLGPGVLAPAADGGVWLSMAGHLVRLTATGVVRRYPLRRGVYPVVLAPARAGAVWFIDRSGRRLGRVTPHGRLRLVRRGFGRRPKLFALAARPGGGGVWATDNRGSIDRVTRTGGVRRITHGVPRRPDLAAIVSAPDGGAWFTDFEQRRVGRVTPHGSVQLYRTGADPTSIAIGSDGAPWYTTAATYNVPAGIGRIRGGHAHELPVHQTCSITPAGLITRPDGTLWMAEDDGPVSIIALDPRRLAQTAGF